MEGTLIGNKADAEDLTWDLKLEKAKNLVKDLQKKPVGFQKYLRKIFHSNITNLNLVEDIDRVVGTNLSPKDNLKLRICCLLSVNRSMTIAEVYESLGTAIKGNEIIAQGYNRIIWDDMREEGISALVELEAAQWIEFHAVSIHEFSEANIYLKESLKRLPVAESVKVKNSDYEIPHWLPVKYSAGLMLIATKLLCTSDKEAETIEKVDYLEIDKFVNLDDIKDERQRVLKSIVIRQGQPQFREGLLAAYGRECAITNCNVLETLEAVHIIPFLGPETNHLSNGLILRADLHTLFDLYLFTIDPESLKVILSPELKNTPYGEFEGKSIRQREKGHIQISKGALNYHYSQCSWVKEMVLDHAY
jgi:predicted restriction endonuclease